MHVVGDHGSGVVVVLGPRTLLLTSIVFGLRAAGLVPQHLPLDPRRPVPDRNGHASGVVLVDVGRAGAAEVAAQAARVGWPVLLVADAAADERAAAAVAAGAVGCLPVDTPFDRLLDAVTAVGAGRAVMTDEERAGWLARDAAARATLQVLQRGFDLLTERETDVLRRLAAGRRPQEVADELFVAITTVRSHIRQILTKLEVNSHELAGARWREYAQLRHRRR